MTWDTYNEVSMFCAPLFEHDIRNLDDDFVVSRKLVLGGCRGGEREERLRGKLICETVIGSITPLWLSDWLVCEDLHSRPLNTHGSRNIYYYRTETLT